MNLKDFKRIAEDKDSFTVEHPSGKKLFLEKAKLSEAAHKHIQCMAQGGQFDNVDGGSTADAVSALGGGDPMASFTPTPAPAPTPEQLDQVSALGGGNPTAAFDVGDELSKLAGASEPFPGGGESVSNGDFTRKSKYLVDPKSQAAIDKVRAEEGPVQGDDDYKPKGGGRAPDATVDPLTQEKMSAADLLQSQIKEQQAAMEAGQAGGNAVAGVQQGTADALAKLPSYNDIVAKYQAKDQRLENAYANKQIDPNHFMNSMSTGSKILTGISMVLSGMGSATTGQPNYAMQVMNDAIKRDMEAQAADKSSKMNLWKMNREMLGSDQAANLATENQIKAGALQQLQAAQTRAMLPQEKLRAQMAIDQIKGEMLKNNLVRGLLTQGQMAAPGQGATLSQTDPAVLVPELVHDEKQRDAVLKEIKARQNITKNGKAMLDAFDQAAAEVSGASGVAHSAIERTPGQLKLQQLMQPNMDLLDGTVRQNAVESADHTIIPSWRDFSRPGYLASKRATLQQWMNSQASAPTAKSNLLDLDRFQSTAIPNQAMPAASAAAPAPQTIERRAKDGRIIIYDAKTKQPLGVKK